MTIKVVAAIQWWIQMQTWNLGIEILCPVDIRIANPFCSNIGLMYLFAQWVTRC